jgi:molybdopterin-guanine dinucleotide biosynthesis protein A
MENSEKLPKPDVLITWPSGVDYPICRFQLQNFRSFFNQVIISIYPHGQPDFTSFLKQVMKKTTFVDVAFHPVKWRENCVMAGLEKVKSDWVLFTEQDFFFKDEYFLYQVLKETKNSDVIGIRQGPRLHPCFLLVKKETLDKTSKKFEVLGQDKDHFYGVSQDLLKIGKFKDIRDLGLFEGIDWYHLSNLTWNLFRIKDGDVSEFHEPVEFLVYNAMSRTRKVVQDARWIAFTFYAETLLSKFGKFLNR